MAIVMETPLKRIREGLKVSREKLVRRTQTVSLGTVRNAEYGRRVTVASSEEILSAINSLLVEAGQEPVTLKDLGLSLY